MRPPVVLPEEAKFINLLSFSGTAPSSNPMLVYDWLLPSTRTGMTSGSVNIANAGVEGNIGVTYYSVSTGDEAVMRSRYEKILWLEEIKDEGIPQLSLRNNNYILGKQVLTYTIDNEAISAGAVVGSTWHNLPTDNMSTIRQLGLSPIIAFISAQSLAKNVALHSRIASLLDSYASFEFEEGIEDELTSQLSEMITNNTFETIEIIKEEISSDRFNPEYVWNLLRRFGDIKDDGSQEARKLLLLEFLTHPSRWFRDGAVLGLLSIGDSNTIISLERAIDRETLPDLKVDLIKALLFLKSHLT